MHNGTIQAGDAWIAANLDAYVQWAKTNNSLFILTFDEDNAAYNNRIVTIFCGPMVKAGQYSKYMNHYTLLRTIEDMYALKHSGRSSDVESVKECWNPVINGIENPANTELTWAVYGFAGTGELNVDYDLPASAEVGLQVFTEDGKLIHNQPFIHHSAGIHRIIINPSERMASRGLYIVRLQVDESIFSKKVLLIY